MADLGGTVTYRHMLKKRDGDTSVTPVTPPRRGVTRCDGLLPQRIGAEQ